MNIQEAHAFLNFFINKFTGAWYTPEELDTIIHRGQMSLYSDLQPRYGTSQRIKDSLSPFRTVYTFGYPDTLNGLITVPTNLDFTDLLDVEITYDISGRGITKHIPVGMANEDVRANRLNSQIDAVTTTSPVGEVIGLGKFLLYPSVQYRGKVTFLRKPTAPFFSYTIVSGRVVVYDPTTSVQLQWKESDHNAIMIKALESVGINLSDEAIMQFAQSKSEENFNGQNRI